MPDVSVGPCVNVDVEDRRQRFVHGNRQIQTINRNGDAPDQYDSFALVNLDTL